MLLLSIWMVSTSTIIQRNLKASLHTAPPQMNKIILSSLSYGVIRVESSHCLVLLFFSKQKHYKDYEMGSRITFFCQELLSRMWWFQFQTDKMQFCQQRKIWKTLYIKFMVDAQLYKWWWVGRVETRRKVFSLVTNFDRARATSTPPQTRPDLIFSSKPIQSQRLQTRSPTQIHAQSIHASPMFQKGARHCLGSDSPPRA